VETGTQIESGEQADAPAVQRLSWQSPVVWQSVVQIFGPPAAAPRQIMPPTQLSSEVQGRPK